MNPYRTWSVYYLWVSHIHGGWMFYTMGWILRGCVSKVSVRCECRFAIMRFIFKYNMIYKSPFVFRHPQNRRGCKIAVLKHIISKYFIVYEQREYLNINIIGFQFFFIYEPIIKLRFFEDASLLIWNLTLYTCFILHMKLYVNYQSVDRTVKLHREQ